MFLNELKKNDFVIGNRFSSLEGIPTSKIASNKFGAKIVNAVFNTKLQDVSCGFRGFKLTSSFTEIKDNKYGFVFTQLFESLTIYTSISTVKMPAIYHKDELHATRHVEVLLFLKALQPYIKQSDLKKKISIILDKIAKKEKFEFQISDTIFYGFYINNHDVYFIQC